MLKKELTAALAMMGAVAPFAAYADQGMTMNQSGQQPTYTAGEALKQGALPGAYNQSANYKIDDSYDVYFTGDFIYWCLQQDGVIAGSSGGSTVFMDASYKPGFQVGLGFNMAGMDNWNMYSEYTWYKNNHTTDTDTGSSKTHYVYNNLNVLLQRPFYMGRKLTANFGFGLRALWLTNNLSYSSGDLDQKSWGLGPRFGLDSNWLLGAGFRLMANAGVSALYTSYTTLNGSLTSSHDNYNTVRAITETSLGLGWGSYFGDNNDFHFDLSASYEFNAYWNQNMAGVLVGGTPRNNYLHGLNVAVRKIIC